MKLFGRNGKAKQAEQGATNINPDTSSSLYISNIPQKGAGNALFLIDPQFDFIDDGGALQVAGAKEDSKRTAEFIIKNKESFNEVYVTLDTHMRYHIAHPLFWKSPGAADGPLKHPGPFTSIRHEDIVNRKWVPVDESMMDWALEYTKTLESSEKSVNRFVLTIWPPHCLIGTKGHNVEVQIAAALKEWEECSGNTVHYIFKGNNSKTEHYSAFRAEVIVPEDESTKFNSTLYNNLMKHDKIYVAGQALSHCVNFTVRDMINEMKQEGKHKLDKICMLKGGMSSVTGFEASGEEFWNAVTGTEGKETKDDIVEFIDLTKTTEAI